MKASEIIKVLDADYKKDEDPRTYKSEKTGRGPLQPGWKVWGNQKIFEIANK